MNARPPIVAILGHVDHGKTTLLDYIRKSTIAAKEHGGITQRIGAYEINTNIKGYKTNKITFIDTPGHEAFSKLRARGANVADIAILIIDAKDSVMPQTAESISHIKAANIPFIVALNKIDLPDANPNKVKTDLLKYEVLVEGKGGTVPVAEISAKTGKGVPEFLETILLLAADLNLNFDPKNPPQAFVIETKKDKRGIVASAIIKDGNLSVGDTVYSGNIKAKIRSMNDDSGKSIGQVSPSTPFEILGFEDIPEVGNKIEAEAKKEQVLPTAPATTVPRKIDMEELLHPQIQEKKLSLIIKTDSFGSLEAIENDLTKNESVKIILKAVGSINKSDVFLAKTTKSIIIGFAVEAPAEVAQLAKQEKVIIKTYNIIYELLDELSEAAKLLAEKEEKEKNMKGEAKIVATFIIEREKVYGIKVTKGKIGLADQIELYRAGKLLNKTKLVSLHIRAKSVNEVKKEQEAGMIFSPPLDIEVGDVVKSVS